MTKDGRNVVSGNAGQRLVDSSGKIKLTNVNGHCAECCSERDPCKLQFCGPVHDAFWQNGPVFYRGPIRVDNLPYLHHFNGYVDYCDQHFKLLQDRSTWYETDEMDVAWTSIDIECLTNGDTKFSVEIIYYDNDDPTKIVWREWRRRTSVDAWPLYKMTPTFDQATNQLTVDIGWRRDPSQDEVYFRLINCEGVSNISYSGSGTVKSSNSTDLVLEDTEDGGTGQISVTLKPLQFNAFSMKLDNAATYWNSGIESIFYKIRSFQSFGSDSVTLSYSGDGNCLICSNYDLFDVEIEIGDCTSNYQIAATENTRPWYWCGVQNHQNESQAELAYNDLILREPERYDLMYMPDYQPNQGWKDQLGPGWPITTDVWGYRFPAIENGYLARQSKEWIELTDSLDLWVLRSPRGHKSQIQNGGTGHSRHILTNDRWDDTGLPPQDRADVPDFNWPIHNWRFGRNSTNSNNMRGWWDKTSRVAVKHPNRWPELNHPGSQSRKFTSTVTIEMHEPDPPTGAFNDPWNGLYGVNEAWADCWIGAAYFGIYYWDYDSEDQYGHWTLQLGHPSYPSLNLWGPLAGHIDDPRWYSGPTPYQKHTLEISADLPNVYDLGFTGRGSLKDDDYTKYITWDIKLGGEDLYTGRLIDNPDGISINTANAYVDGDYDQPKFFAMAYPGPPNCWGTVGGGAIGLDAGEQQYQYYAKQVGFSMWAGCEDAGWRRIPPGQPDICPPDLLNKPTKMCSISNIEHKVEYV